MMGVGSGHYVRTPKIRHKCRLSHLGQKPSPETIEKLRIASTGRKHSQETRDKIRLKTLGNKRPLGIVRSLEFREGVRQRMLGKKLSPETREKIRNSKLGKPGYIRTAEIRSKVAGSRGSNWKGGVNLINEGLRNTIRKTFEYFQWRREVFLRDKWTCRGCGGVGGNYLHAHHIKRFQDIVSEYGINTVGQALECSELWDINNGVSLCIKCHRKTHKGGGTP